VRANLLIRGILPIIPPKANRREPIACDFHRYRGRNRIEACSDTSSISAASLPDIARPSI